MKIGRKIVSVVLIAISSTIATAEPVIFANEFLVDSASIGVKIHGLEGEDYIVDVVTPMASINYGCPYEGPDEAARVILTYIADAISNGSLDLVNDGGCNERRRY